MENGLGIWSGIDATVKERTENMNGRTMIDPILNPCSAEMDRRTYGTAFLNVCFWGRRLLKVTIGRLTVDIHLIKTRPFTAMGGGANGTARYWMLFWPLGKVMWIFLSNDQGEARR